MELLTFLSDMSQKDKGNTDKSKMESLDNPLKNLEEEDDEVEDLFLEMMWTASWISSWMLKKKSMKTKNDLL